MYLITKYEEHSNFKNKGKRGQRCNRTACEDTEAYYYNRIMDAYYCQPCAHKINDGLDKNIEPICTLSEEDKTEWRDSKYRRYM